MEIQIEKRENANIYCEEKFTIKYFVAVIDFALSLVAASLPHHPLNRANFTEHYTTVLSCTLNTTKFKYY